MASSGKLGALVVIIAIVGTILGGTALGADEVTRTSTDYSFVSDISGLFPYSDQPIYSEYNPSMNLTGFYTGSNNYTSGIDYQVSSGLSNYPIIQETTTSSGSSSVPSGLSNFVDKKFTRFPVKLYPDMGMSNDGFYYAIGSANYNLLSEVIEPILTSDVAKIRINGFDYTEGDPIIIRTTDIQLIEGSVWATPKPYYPTLNPVSYYEFDTTTQIFKAIGTDDTVVWQTNIDSVVMVSGGDVYPFTLDPGVSSLKTAFSYTLYLKNSPIYIDPAYGVRIQSGEDVYWKNGYTMSKMSFLFINPQDDENEYSTTILIPNITHGFYENGWPAFQMVIESYYDEVSVDVNKIRISNDFQKLSTLSSDSYSFDNWKAIKIDLDFLNTTFTLTPVGPATGQSWPDFQNNIEYPELSKSGSMNAETMSFNFRKGLSDNLVFSTESMGQRFLINNTSVFMDTYINVIYNTGFLIGDYFPDVTYPRLDLKSFSMYGNSIRINTVLFEGLQDGYIDVVDTNGRERSLLFDNVRLLFGNADDDHVYMQFMNDNVLVDLGERTASDLYFGGAWYLAADLYEGETVTTTGYEFNPLQWAFDSNTAIIFYLGLLALCSIIGARYSNFGWGDIILVSCAGIVGFLILV